MLTFGTTVKTAEHVTIELALVILFPLTQDHNIIHGAQFLNVTSNYQPHLTLGSLCCIEYHTIVDTESNLERLF